MNRATEDRYLQFIRNLVLVTALLVVLFPYLWIAVASIKPPDMLSQPDLFGFTPVLNSWTNVLFETDVPAFLGNSLVVGAVTVLIALVAGAPAAYSFSRFRTGGESVRFGVLAAQMIPPAVIIVPLYLIMFQLRLLDTIWAVVAAHLTFVLPVVTWFLIGFFDEVPSDVIEQGMVDGCTPFQSFFLVALPIVRPGLAASAIFGFVLSWNDMFYSLLLTGGDGRTLPAAIAGFWTFRGVELGNMSAAILMAVVPVLIASFFIQKYLIHGVSGGSVKH